MPRYERFNYLFDAFKMVLDKCVKNDQSILWPDKKIWTIENLQLLQDKFINTPNFDTTLSFEEKLSVQLGENQPQLWAIIADVYYIYYLPPTQLKYSTKKNGIIQFSAKIQQTMPDEKAKIWEPLIEGFCNTGQRYNQKYRQFWLIINFFLELKRRGNVKDLINTRESFKNIFDEKMNEFKSIDRAYDIRHALLYLAFPDYYEPIISSRHKQKIAAAFWQKEWGEMPPDPDDALYILRDKQKGKLGGDDNPYFFYDTEIRKIWDTTKKVRKTGKKDNKIAEIGDDYGKIDLSVTVTPLSFTNNLILYGPPGTGKTFLANKIAKELIREQIETQPGSIVLQDVVDQLKVYKLIALAMYVNNPKGSLTVDEIKALPLIESRYSMYPIQRENESIWGSLQIHSNPESKTINVTNRQFPYLFNKTPEAKWYLDKDGIEYVEQNLNTYLEILKKKNQSLTESDFIKWVTFHQSFSYEEFIEGLRPVVDEEAEGTNHIEIVPGIFKTICARASSQPDLKFVLVIDEINRGNISRIFGELITLIEDDKRAGAENELELVLPYSKDTFKVPKNLYIIGTMNTADRSIALLDVALRRRFAFMEVASEPGILKDIDVENGDLSINLEDLLDSLNKKIRKVLDKDHQIGHSYFLKISDYEGDNRIDALQFTWNYQVLPLLEEYFYSQPDQLLEILKPFVGSAEESDKEEISILMRLEGEELLATLDELITNQNDE